MIDKKEIARELFNFIISSSPVQDKIKDELDEIALRRKIDKTVEEYWDKVDLCMEESSESDKIKEYQLQLMDILVGNVPYDKEQLIESFKNENPSVRLTNDIKELVIDGADIFYRNFNEYFTVGERAILNGLRDVAKDINETKSYVREMTKNGSRSNNPVAMTEVVFKDSKQEYIDKWNARMFLSTDENPVTLSEAFIMPDYFGKYEEDIQIDLEYKLYSLIEKKENDVIIILGVPGMGKSSIVSKLSNEYGTDDNVIVLKFKELLSETITQPPNLLSSICGVLGCTKRDLYYKTLILDGFDEIRTFADKQLVLKDFLLDILDLRQFKLLITSRINYIDVEEYKENYDIFTLEYFDKGKISRFYESICHRTIPDDTDIDNKEVLGIPVILYMAVSVGIDLSERISRYEIYDKIFSPRGGIFDRFAHGNIKGYGLPNHTIAYMKERFRLILQRIAFEMFNNNIACISNADYISVVKEYIKDIQDERYIFEFPIKNLYESNKNIEFVHNSIYEFFVAEYIYDILNKSIGESCEYMAGALGKILHSGVLTDEIKEFLKYKFNNGSLKDKHQKILDVFNLMLEDGMLYHAQKCYKNGLQCELRIFSNMLNVIHLWDFNNILDISLKIESYILSIGSLSYHHISFKDLSQFNLEHAHLEGADLVGIDLRDTNLRYAYLGGADLEDANLVGTDLRGANLEGANLEEANLEEAYLVEANLVKANLEEANLEGVDLRGADLKYANLSGANLEEANLEGADLKGAYLVDANLEGAYLGGANLEEAHLEHADLKGADLVGSDLRYAYLGGADLEDANLVGTDLRDANLEGANLVGIDLNYVI